MSLLHLQIKSIWIKMFIAFGYIYVLMWVFCAPQYSSAAELTVHEGESIQDTIDLAQNDDVITISAGIYEENIIVSKTLTMIGEDGAIIDGSGKGNVITVENVDGVTITNLTIRNSGKIEHASGIYLDRGANHLLENNQFENNHFGIYVDKGNDHCIVNNHIVGRNLHFSERGNGIHLYKGSGHILEKNTIKQVQDGVYFDFTEDSNATNNFISDSRYGLHYMYSEKGFAEKNEVVHNITGMLVMDSAQINIVNNFLSDHFHVRGNGIMIYRSNDIFIKENELIRNSTAISFEQVVHSEVEKNIIATNQIGLEFIGENEDNVFIKNNFITNIVQSKIASKGMRLDNGSVGNYWDDYGLFDVTGDGIGEERYKAGSLYDLILEKQPEWQFFFESPAVKLWSKAESMFPTISKTDVYDELPAVEPFPLTKREVEEAKRNHYVAMLSILFIVTSTFILSKGRRF